MKSPTTLSDAGSGASTLATVLAAQLRETILNGQLLPGAKLNLGELKNDFGVSFSPLREALSRLSNEGLVEIEDQKGYRTSPISEENLIEVTRLRAYLEPLALAESVRHGDETWESNLVAAHYRLGKLEDPAERAKRIEDWERHHRAFHDALLAGCPMVLLLQFCRTLSRLKDRYRRLFRDLVLKSRTSRDIPGEHRQMLEAALSRNEKVAAESLRSHIELTGSALLAAMRLEAARTPDRSAPRGRRVRPAATRRARSKSDA